MMTFRTISAGGMGKLIRAYLTENSNFAPEPEEGSNAAVLSKYYGRDARATWRPDMAPEVAEALGIDITKPPTPEALDRLFEAKRGNDAGPWSAASRNISAYDLTISPEKSVSLAFAFAKTDEERAALLQAIWRANDRTMRYVAKEIGWARRGDGGKDGAEPGEVAWSSFMHFSARPTLALQDGPDGETYVVDAAVPGDPQVHIHNALFNAVVTAAGHVGSLDTKELHGRVKEFGAFFQAFLSNELDVMGIKLEYDQGEQAVAIASIPQAVRDAFSKGHKATVSKAQQFAKEQGLDWNAIGIERKLGILNATAANTRLQKSDGRPDQAVWDEAAAKLGWQHETAITGDRREVLTDQERIARATEFAARHIEKEFATAAVIDQNVVRVHATRGLIGVGIKGEGDIEAVVRRLERNGVIVNGTHAALIVGEIDGKLRVTNSVQVKLERDMATLVHQASRAPAGAVPETTFRQAVVDSGIDFTGTMGKAQLAAAERFAFGGGLVFLEGVAGVGKTSRVLPPAVLSWQRDGRKVFGISQAWRQADALKEAGVDETIAVHPFLAGVQSGDIVVDRNTVLVIDEAAQLGPRQFLEMMKLWRDTGCTIRGLGDSEQCQSIEASSAIEIMVRNMPDEAAPQLLDTVRQKTARAREIATLFRDGQAATALDMKIADGHASLIGGDYDQVVRRIAAFYVERRDALQEHGSKRGVTVTALTNADATEISRAIRGILRDRGEVAGAETVYQAINNRGETYDLPVAAGDKFRLYKKTFAQIDGKRGFIGANGDVVTVKGWWDRGLVLEDQAGRIGHVEWRRLLDPTTKRLLLGYGHCLTVDAAQGITSAEHINALPRGSAGITAFKGYVAESRHENMSWTLVSKGAELQAEQAARALGDPTEITDALLWKRVAKNMSEKPYKALGIDLVDQARQGQDSGVDGFIRTSRRIRKAREADNGENVGVAARARVQAKAVRKSLDGKMAPVSEAMARQGEVLEAAQEVLGRAGMRGRLAVHLNPKRQQGPDQARQQSGPKPF